MEKVIMAFAGLVAAALALTALSLRTRQPERTVRAVVSGLVGVNGLVVLTCGLLVIVMLGAAPPVLAQSVTGTTGTSSSVALGAALATGLACIGAGIAVGIAGAAAIGGITEKPEILGRTLIFVGLAEGIAIYGLIVSFIILNA